MLNRQFPFLFDLLSFQFILIKFPYNNFANLVKQCYNYSVVNPIRQREGGVILLVSFTLSVLAGIVAYYICKWLDGKDDNN